jgi:hypothetical protein
MRDDKWLVGLGYFRSTPQCLHGLLHGSFWCASLLVYSWKMQCWGWVSDSTATFAGCSCDRSHCLGPVCHHQRRPWSR